MSDSTIIGLFILLEIPWMILLIKVQKYLCSLCAKISNVPYPVPTPKPKNLRNNDYSYKNRSHCYTYHC